MTTPTGVLFQNPRVKPLSSTGAQMPLCTATFYVTGTTTPANVYAEGTLVTPLANPLTSDAAGTFAAVYMDPNIIYRVIVKDSTGTQISDTDPYVPAPAPIVSGTFTMGSTGLTGNPSATAQYTILFGRWVLLNIGVYSAVSTSTAFTLTGLPAALQIQSVLGTAFESGHHGAVDNGAEISAELQLSAGSSVITLLKNGAAAGWTASGSKGFGNQLIIYPLF